MTSLLEAKKILGKLAIGLSDVEILNDIESAILLKDMFFNIFLSDISKKRVKSINDE